MRILVVDDDRAVRESLRRSLSFNGYSVTLAEDGVEALEAIAADRPDGVVLDVMMPRLDGLEVCRRLRSTGDDLPILVLTARAQMAEYFADKQIDGFIAKPCDPEDLAMEVSRIIFQRGVVAPEDLVPASPVALVGDPDAEQRELIAGVLRSDSCEVRTFDNGAALLEAAVLEPPAVVLMRLEMGDHNACVIASMLRNMPRTSDLPVIIYGTGTEETDIEHAGVADEIKCKMLVSSDPQQLAAVAARLFGR